MVLAEQPLSREAEHWRGYQARIRTAAARRMAGAPPRTGRLYARVVWMQLRDVPGDVDNILKRLLDVLEQVVFENDRDVAELLVQRVGLRECELSGARFASDVFDELDQLVVAEEPHILYVEVGAKELQLVEFGPI